MGTGMDSVDSKNNDNNIINTIDDVNLDFYLRLLKQFCAKILQRDYFIKTVKITDILGNILVEQKRMGGIELYCRSGTRLHTPRI